jgi:hypothetical protein
MILFTGFLISLSTSRLTMSMVTRFLAVALGIIWLSGYGSSDKMIGLTS